MTDIDDFYKDYFHDHAWNPYVMKELLRFIPLKGCNILDVGCGTGEKSKHFKRGGNKVTGLDISEAQIERAKEVLDSAIVQNINVGLPFADNEFDITYSSMVLEHIFDFKFILEEMNRVLRPNGKVIIEVPNVMYWPNRLLMLLGKDLIWIGIGKHIRAFNKNNLKRSLEKTGFRKVKVIGSILPIPKTGLKVHFPYLNRIFPGLCFSLIAIAEK